MGGSSTTNTTGNSQSINEIPQWVQNAGQANYGFAQQVATRPLQQYQGQMVADVAPQMQQSWDMAANSGNVGVDASNAAQAGYLNTLGQTPQMNVPYWAGKAPNTTSYWAGKAPNTVAQQGVLAPDTVAAQAAKAQQAALAAPTTASTAKLSTLGGMNLEGYMNPYTQDVINKTLPIMNQSLQQQQNALQNQANSTNAFGGSRQAINQGVLGSQGAQSEAQMAAQLNLQNFQQAQQAGIFDVGQANQMGEFNANQLNQVGMYNQGQANQVGMYNAGQGNQVNMYNAGQQNQVAMQNQQLADAMSQFNAQQGNQVGMYNQGQNNQMSQFNAGQANQVGMYNQGQANAMSQFNAGQANTINTANQAAGLTQEGLVNAASAGLSNVSNQQVKNNLANYGMLASAGGLQQQQQQNDINASIAKYNQAFNYPTQQLGILESSLGMTPYNTGTSGSSSSTTTTSENNPAAIATGAFGMLGDMFGAGGAGTALLGGISDRRLKTDIKRIGVHHTGIPMYSYRYKGDPKHYPKIAGPMAEDVMKIAPHAVRPMDTKGHLAVHMPTLDALNTPPSSPGAARAIGMLSPSGMPGRLSPFATPPTRSMMPRGALGG